MCTMLEADEMRAGTLTYYRVRYEFRIRYDEVKTRNSNGDVQTVVFGWVKRIRDEGYREWIGTNTDGTPKYRSIVDDEGHLVSQPQLLGGIGLVMKESDINNPPLPEICFFKFDVYKKRPFSALNI